MLANVRNAKYCKGMLGILGMLTQCTNKKMNIKQEAISDFAIQAF